MRPGSLDLTPATLDELPPTDNLFQSRFWARFRRTTGAEVRAVRLAPDGDPMVVQHERRGDFQLAYVAAGPDVDVAEEDHGRFLERLSHQLLERTTAGRSTPPCAIRYDLPWESPYDDPVQRPSVRAREIRMNFGTEEHRLVKATSDRLAPDTIAIDLERKEQTILAAMRPKTRYNIRLAGRRGVHVRIGSPRELHEWHELYRTTAERKGFRPREIDYFQRLFRLAAEHRPELRLYLAYAPGADGSAATSRSTLLGGIVVAHAGASAVYLYGASSQAERGMMAPYALQWHAITEARNAGCRRYDLFGIPPAADPGHPMYGLYRFKTGFGGKMVHRRGAWDYVRDEETYRLYRAGESTSSGYYAS